MMRDAGSSFIYKAALFFALLVAANYWPVFQGRIPLPTDIVLNFPPWEGWRGGKPISNGHAEMGDVVTLFYPFRLFTVEAIRLGTLPLWNPYILAGTPFLGEPQSALFYPLNLFYYFLPTPWAWTARLLLTIVLAGLFASLFTKALGCSAFGAIASGMIFAFSGFITAWQGFMLLDSALWLPLALWSVDRLLRIPTPFSVALAGAAFAMPVLAGHPETAAHITMVGTAFAVYRWALPLDVPLTNGSKRMRYLALFVGAGLLALALAAVQILPTLEWLGQIEHGLHLKWGARPPHEILAFFSRDIVHSYGLANIFVPEGAAYAGMLTLLAVSLAPLHRNRRDVAFFGVLLAAALMVVYGWGPVYWASQNAPVIGGLKNTRLLLAADFSLAVLAGFGISALGEESVRQQLKGRRILWLMLPAVVLVCSGVAIWILQSSTDRWLWSRSPFSSLILLLASVALVAWRLFGHLAQRRFHAMAIILLGVDLLSFSHHYSPFASTEEIFPNAPVFQFLQDHAGSQHRVGALNGCIPNNFRMMYGLFSVDGYDIALRRTQRLLQDLGEYPTNGVSLLAERLAASPDRRLDMMNVKYLVACYQAAEILERMPDRFSPAFSVGSVRIFENHSVLPRAFLVPNSSIEVLPNEATQLARLRDPLFNPGESVILPSALSSTEEFPAQDPLISQTRILETEYAINEVRLRAELREPSILVVSQIYYPGWEVWVDGVKKQLLRPDYALQGVALTPGIHDVRFAYMPASFRIGLFSSLMAALILVGLLTVEVIQRYVRRTQSR